MKVDYVPLLLCYLHPKKGWTNCSWLVPYCMIVMNCYNNNNNDDDVWIVICKQIS